MGGSLILFFSYQTKKIVVQTNQGKDGLGFFFSLLYDGLILLLSLFSLIIISPFAHCIFLHVVLVSDYGGSFFLSYRSIPGLSLLDFSSSKRDLFSMCRFFPSVLVCGFKWLWLWIWEWSIKNKKERKTKTKKHDLFTARVFFFPRGFKMVVRYSLVRGVGGVLKFVG